MSKNLSSSRLSRQAGFTLTELLVVMVVLSLLAAAITPQVMGRLDRSKARAADLQLQTLSASLDMFKIDTGRYPTTQEGLSSLLSPTPSMERWDGPYVKSARSIIDPWDNPFEYQAAGSRYTIITFGADGVVGGDGHDADRSFPDVIAAQTGGRP